jgi:hypothetical protein
MNETTITTRTSSRSGSSWSSARRARTRLLRLDGSTADPEWSGDGTVVEEMDVRPREVVGIYQRSLLELR